MTRRPSPARLFLVLALTLGLAACDTTEVVEISNEIRVVDFSFGFDEYELSEDTRTASFVSDNIEDGSDREAVREALDDADLGAVVLLYADNTLILEGIEEGTFQALPVTTGVEGVVTVDGTDVPYVDYIVTYSYAFDDADLYFDVFSTARADSFDPEDEFAFFDSFLPDEIDLRLVTIPAETFSARTGLDASGETGTASSLQSDAAERFRTYADLARAFDLPGAAASSATQ